jgi:hypothetical protein
MSDVAGIGHNNPPAVAGDYTRLQNRLQELLDSAGRAPSTIENEEQAEKCTNLTKMLKELAKAADTARVQEKAPHLDAGRAVDAFFSKISEPSTLAAKDMEKRLTAYVQAQREAERKRALEEARKAKEEADRMAAEAAELEQAGMADMASQTLADAQKVEATASRLEAKAADDKQLGKVRSELGSTSLRKTWRVEIADRSALDWATLGRFLTDDAILAALRGYVQSGGRELSGARIWQEETTVVR